MTHPFLLHGTADRVRAWLRNVEAKKDVNCLTIIGRFGSGKRQLAFEVLREAGFNILEVVDKEQLETALFFGGEGPKVAVVCADPDSSMLSQAITASPRPVIVTVSSWYPLPKWFRDHSEKVYHPQPDYYDLTDYANWKVGTIKTEWLPFIKRITSYPQLDALLATGIMEVEPPDLSVKEVVEELHRDHEVKGYPTCTTDELMTWVADNNIHHPQNRPIVVKIDLLRRKVRDEYIMRMLLCCRGGGNGVPASFLYRPSKAATPSKSAPKPQIKVVGASKEPPAPKTASILDFE